MGLSKEECERRIKVFKKNECNLRATADSLGLTHSSLRDSFSKAKTRFGLEIPASQGNTRQQYTATDLRKVKSLTIDVPTKERLRIRELENIVKHLTNTNRALAKEVITAANVKQLIRDTNVQPKRTKWKIKLSPKETSGVPIMALSDIHYDELVDPAQINYINAFNRQIANERLRTYFSKTIDLLFNHLANPRYEYVVLACIGDLLSGNIHEELRETNETPIGKSIISLKDQLISGIDLLKEAFGKVFIPVVVGNHGRFDQRKRYKNRAYDSFEFLLMHMVSQNYSNDPDVDIRIADGSDLRFNVHNTWYLMNHGDEYHGGTGIAGALSPLMLGDARKRKNYMAMKMPYDFQMCGHWHQYIVAKGLIINGSVKGAEEYSTNRNFEFERPQQAVWLNHPNWGITLRWPVQLERPGRTYTGEHTL